MMHVISVLVSALAIAETALSYQVASTMPLHDPRFSHHQQQTGGQQPAPPLHRYTRPSPHDPRTPLDPRWGPSGLLHRQWVDAESDTSSSSEEDRKSEADTEYSPSVVGYRPHTSDSSSDSESSDDEDRRSRLATSRPPLTSELLRRCAGGHPDSFHNDVRPQRPQAQARREPPPPTLTDSQYRIAAARGDETKGFPTSATHVTFASNFDSILASGLLAERGGRPEQGGFNLGNFPGDETVPRQNWTAPDPQRDEHRIYFWRPRDEFPPGSGDFGGGGETFARVWDRYQESLAWTMMDTNRRELVRMNPSRRGVGFPIVLHLNLKGVEGIWNDNEGFSAKHLFPCFVDHQNIPPERVTHVLMQKVQMRPVHEGGREIGQIPVPGTALTVPIRANRRTIATFLRMGKGYNFFVPLMSPAAYRTYRNEGNYGLDRQEFIGETGFHDVELYAWELDVQAGRSKIPTGTMGEEMLVSSAQWLHAVKGRQLHIHNQRALERAWMEVRREAEAHFLGSSSARSRERRSGRGAVGGG